LNPASLTGTARTMKKFPPGLDRPPFFLLSFQVAGSRALETGLRWVERTRLSARPALQELFSRRDWPLSELSGLLEALRGRSFRGRGMSAFRFSVFGLGSSVRDIGYSGCDIGFSLGGIGFSLCGIGFSLGGIGFSLGGIGFSLGGIGFSLGGIGFSLDGIGFSLAGIGYSLEEKS